MRDTPENVRAIELFAWVGEDEHGSGAVGLKQAICPAGTIPMVSVYRGKMDQEYIRRQMLAQAELYGKTIRLCRFVMVEELVALEPKGGAS